MATMNMPNANDTAWYSSVDANWTAIENDLIDKSIVTTKGDLITATAASTPTRFGVGTDGQVLTADSTQSTGLNWGSGPSGSNPTMTSIGELRSDRTAVRNYARTLDMDSGRLFAMAKALSGGSTTNCVCNLDITSKVVTTNSAASAFDSSFGSGQQLTTFSGSPTTVCFVLPVSTSIPFACLQWSPFFRMRIKTDTSLAFLRMWIGFFSASPSADNPSGANLMGFRFTMGVDKNWQCCTKDGTTLNQQDSGVVVTSNTVYTLEIRTNASGNIEFYINNSLVATSSANLPGASTVMNNIGFYGTNTAGSGTTVINWSDLYASQD